MEAITLIVVFLLLSSLFLVSYVSITNFKATRKLDEPLEESPLQDTLI